MKSKKLTLGDSLIIWDISLAEIEAFLLSSLMVSDGFKYGFSSIPLKISGCLRPLNTIMLAKIKMRIRAVGFKNIVKTENLPRIKLKTSITHMIP